MSHESYRRAARAANPRDAEYEAFGEATRLLMAARDTGRDDLKFLIDALHRNRLLWSALADDCADARNALPEATRARIIALARWVGTHTSAVMREKESVDPLIDVNRIIMEGLGARTPAA